MKLKILFLEFLDGDRIIEDVPEYDDEEKEGEREEDPGGPVHQQHLLPAQQHGYTVHQQHLLPAQQHWYTVHQLLGYTCYTAQTVRSGNNKAQFVF